MKTSSFRTIVKRSLCLSTFLTGALVAPITAQAAGYDGPRITFEQIYANPDDQQLNLNYARQQADKGDFISAAAALERMLFAQPDWDSARLFYALVLYKLDDKQAAFSELDTLAARPLSPDQRAQAQAYRKEFSETAPSANTSNFSGRIAFGVRYDDNAGNALADTFLAFANQDDTSAFLQGSLQFTTPINESGDFNFRAGVYGQTRRHETFSNADYDTFGGNLGFGGDIGDGLSWAIDGQAMQVNISGSKYLTQVGGQLKLSTSLSTQTTLWGSGGWYDQDYNDLSFTAGETLRSGDKILLLIGAKHKFSDNANFGVSAGYEDKNATSPLFAYNGLRVSGNFFNGFDNGLYMRGSATFRNLDYKGPSPNREDSHIYGRIGFGASLNSMGGWMGMEPSPSLSNMFLELAGNYTNRDSNIATLKYENVGAELKFLWDF